jgi:hypothetical protein
MSSGYTSGTEEEDRPMPETAALKAWESFYVIAGSSAGALIGLQFVVITLVAESRLAGTGQEISAFGTPTILHFGAVLLISAIVSAPWPTLVLPSVALGLIGVGGLVYAVMVLVKARRSTGYSMVVEDWIWHIILPVVAYAVLTAGSVWLQPHPLRSLFGIGGAALLLLFIGIHNAWDTTTWVVMNKMQNREPDGGGG